jgi:adenylate cyclase
MERKLTAILCADVYGYSRLMGEDEEGTLRTLSSRRKLVDSLIEQHRGRFINSAGDSVLAEFVSVVNAVQCAVEIQNTLQAENMEVPPDRRMQFRIGVNLGDVMVEGDQIYGDGVNVAARLESLADPGGICISHTVHDQIKNKLSLIYQDLGEQRVKNIAEPLRAFRVLVQPGSPSLRLWRARELFRRGAFAIAGVVIIIGTVLLVQHVSLKPQPSHASIQPPQSPSMELPHEPSIAVLPFVNLSGDPKQEYFSEGLTDYLINDLSRLPGVFVIARNSSFVYRGKNVSVQQVGRDLGVRLVLEGTVLKAANRVRISVELADAASGANRWAARFDRPLQDIFALQDEIVGKIVATLNLIFQLGPHGVPVSPATAPLYTPANLEAFDCFLRGVEDEYGLTKEQNQQAQNMFKRAIKLDPNYVDAYVNLGFAYWLAWGWGWNDDPHVLGQVSEMAQRADALDDADPGVHMLLAMVDLFHNHEYAKAITEARRAVDLNPNFLPAYSWLAETLTHAGRGTEAVAWADKAMRLDPLNRSWYLLEVGQGYAVSGQYSQAIAALQEHLARYPDSLGARAFLAISYSEVGQEQQARSQVSEMKRTNPQFTLALLQERGTFQDPKLAERFSFDLSKAGLR